MKLIIDIDENIYNQIREGFYEYNVDKMGIAIVDGIPLEQVIAEIRRDVLEIIDKYRGNKNETDN